MKRKLPKNLPYEHKLLLNELYERANDSRMPPEWRAWCHSASVLLLQGDLDYERALEDARAKGILRDAFGEYADVGDD